MVKRKKKPKRIFIVQGMMALFLLAAVLLGAAARMSVEAPDKAQGVDTPTKKKIGEIYARAGNYTAAYYWLSQYDWDNDTGWAGMNNPVTNEAARAALRLTTVEIASVDRRMREERLQADLAGARSGNVMSQVSLGRRYERGDDVVGKDAAEAYFWYSLPVVQYAGSEVLCPLFGFSAAELAANRNRAAKSLTPEQRATADARIAAWARKNPVTSNGRWVKTCHPRECWDLTGLSAAALEARLYGPDPCRTQAKGKT
jgi:hypothetical protein